MLLNLLLEILSALDILWSCISSSGKQISWVGKIIDLFLVHKGDDLI